MSHNLPPDIITRAREILQPLVSTVAEREALLTEAFYLVDPLLYYDIEREGTPSVFCVHCVKTLLDRGCLRDRQHSLSRLLRVARSFYGLDKHREIDELVTAGDTCCQSPANAPESAVGAAPPEKPASKEKPAHKPINTPIQTIGTPREDRRPTVFVSYSHGDKINADRLIADLNGAGHACWIDTSEIKGGDKWVEVVGS